MKIVFTGGGTGGHFYPIIAVAQDIHKIVKEKHLVEPKLYFMSPHPYDEAILYDNKIKFIKIPSGKIRRYFSVLNIIDILLMPFNILIAMWKMLFLYPDVVFSKGGYGSFPPLFAARFFRIPVLIHESDTVPGKVNAWSGKFAYRIALSYEEAGIYFKNKPISVTGNPIRRDLQIPPKDIGKEFFNIESNIQTILVLGGSQGSMIINETILDALPDLIDKYYIIHQVGDNNLKEMKIRADIVLGNHRYKNRYKIYGHLNVLDLKMSAGACDIVISRAGSTIFEIASWSVPSIIIPITSSNGDHQRKNAFSYARTGACSVIEENNLKPHVVVSEIQRILSNPEIKNKMSESCKKFVNNDAGHKIASELLSIGLSHEQ
jgi:UDP-N-acetylglucosamine--N-acetylmuramyl-(pentapeptide) pyrophosphoryl-undecaprenol N-acetylglucosamine transferase